MLWNESQISFKRDAITWLMFPLSWIILLPKATLCGSKREIRQRITLSFIWPCACFPCKRETLNSFIFLVWYCFIRMFQPQAESSSLLHLNPSSFISRGRKPGTGRKNGGAGSKGKDKKLSGTESEQEVGAGSWCRTFSVTFWPNQLESTDATILASWGQSL